MTTGDNFAKFNSKGLVNYEDWGSYFMDYLRNSLRKSVKSRWSINGTLDVALTLSGIAGGIVVNGSSWQTDARGNILDISAATTRQALFENSLGVTYYVACPYAEAPSDVRASPRTGAMQYGRFVELLGNQSNPDSLVNNGNGTLTFTVNGLTQSGHSFAGRTVRVYKLVPGLNATTLAIAVEDCIVTFTGGNNKITTVGLFGQAGTPSTIASDYSCILLGPYVSTDPSIANSDGYAFVGTVIGVGGSGTPTAFDTSGQRILKSLNDATQITYTPANPGNWPNPDPITAQQGLDDIVANLISTTIPGASLVANAALPAFADATVVVAGSLAAQLSSLLTALGGTQGAKKVGSVITTAGLADGYQPPTGSIWSQLNALVARLGDLSNGSVGIGSPASFGSPTPFTVPSDNVWNQIGYLLSFSNILAQFAAWTFDAGTTTSGSIFAITIDQQVGGFTEAVPDEIQVPAVGKYEVLVVASLQTNDATADDQIGINIQVAGSTVAAGAATRPNTATGSRVVVSVLKVVTITTPALQRIRFTNFAGVSVVCSSPTFASARIRRLQ